MTDPCTVTLADPVDPVFDLEETLSLATSVENTELALPT
jgi:hypothetical protein